MGWTDTDTVKKHLVNLDLCPTVYNDVAAYISATGTAQLPHRGIVSLSEKVKRMLQLEPTAQASVTLNGETWVQLSYSDLVPEEIVIGSDDGLGTVYQRDLDYAFDPENGKVRRIDGGAISDGADVQLYYLRYEVMTKGSDYSIDYSTGVLTRLPGGDLEPETTVWVDYQLSAASGADQLIDEAITEAEDKILARLKDDYNEESTDQGLVTGATELTLAVVCRGMAANALADGVTAAEGRARGWRDLSEHFERSAWLTLRPFLSMPVLKSGDKKSNQSWEWA